MRSQFQSVDLTTISTQMPGLLQSSQCVFLNFICKKTVSIININLTTNFFQKIIVLFKIYLYDTIINCITGKSNKKKKNNDKNVFITRCI